MLFTRLSLLSSRRFVPGSGTPSTITPNVSVTRTSGIGPLAITFDATATTSTQTTMPFQDLLVLWNFGDDDAPTWAYGARPGVLKKNRATGCIAAHLYETPGTYTWTATFYDGVSWASTSGSVTVSDPATVYAGSATICVSSSELPVAGVNGVPAGAQCFQLATIELACAKFTANNQRLLLKAGDTFTCSNTHNIPAFSGLTIGKYGTGAKPMINAITSRALYGIINPSANDVRIMDLQAVTPHTGTFAVRFSNHSRSDLLLFRLDMTLVSSIAEHGGSRNYTFECTIDSPLGGSGNVGLWYAGGTHHAAIGNSITNCTNIEHNMRTHFANYSVFSNNTFTDNAVGKHLQAYRGDSNGVIWAEKAIICDNCYDQGASPSFTILVQIAPTAAAYDEKFKDIIFERNVLYHRVGTAVNGSLGITTQSGIRVRNNIFFELGGGGVSIHYTDGSTNVTVNGTDFACQNNSAWVALTSGYSFIGLRDNKVPKWTGGLIENNLVYAPGVTRDNNNQGTTGTTIWVADGISTPANYVAYTNSTGSQIKGTAPGWVNQPPTVVTDFALTGGSYAIGAGTACPVWEDFFGTLRTGTMDMGAVVG